MIDMMIIGSQKAATTSLKNYLGEHPQIITHPHMEFDFFADDTSFENGISVAFDKYFNAKEFGDKKVVAKNASLYYTESGLQRLKHYNPNCKIIFILRNPVERAFSAYLMGKRHKWIEPSETFSSVVLESIKRHNLGNFDNTYRLIVGLSLYAHYLENIYNYFSKKQVFVILYEELKQDPIKVCQELFGKIGVNEAFVPTVDVIHNKGGQPKSVFLNKLINQIENSPLFKNAILSLFPETSVQKLRNKIEVINTSSTPTEVMDTEIREYLIEYFKPYNAQCEKLIGIDLSYWNH